MQVQQQPCRKPAISYPKDFTPGFIIKKKTITHQPSKYNYHIDMPHDTQHDKPQMQISNLHQATTQTNIQQQSHQPHIQQLPTPPCNTTLNKILELKQSQIIQQSYEEEQKSSPVMMGTIRKQHKQYPLQPQNIFQSADGVFKNYHQSIPLVNHPQTQRKMSDSDNVKVKEKRMLSQKSKRQSIYKPPQYKQQKVYDGSIVKKINQQINNIMEKRKAKLNNTQLTQQNPQKSIKQYYPQINKIYRKRQHKQAKNITYRTSIPQLKDIIHRKQYNNTNIKIPPIFESVVFSHYHSKEEVYLIACQLFQSLGFPIDSLIVKKYSNCILMSNRNICVLWHFDGRFYLGGWEIQYLDEGVRHGVGLQHAPNKYTYYGQYHKNKREGYGVMFKSSGEVIGGLWRQGKFDSNLSTIQNIQYDI